MLISFSVRRAISGVHNEFVMNTRFFCLDAGFAGFVSAVFLPIWGYTSPQRPGGYRRCRVHRPGLRGYSQGGALKRVQRTVAIDYR